MRTLGVFVHARQFGLPLSNALSRGSLLLHFIRPPQLANTLSRIFCYLSWNKPDASSNNCSFFFSRHSVLSSLLIHVLVIPLCTDQLALIYYYYLACNMYASTIWLMLSAQILPKWCIPATISTEYTNVRKGAVAEARLHAFGLTRDRVLKEGTLASTDLPRISGTM